LALRRIRLERHHDSGDDGNLLPRRDSHAYPHANCNSDSDSYSYANGHTNSDSDADSHGYSYSYTDCNINPVYGEVFTDTEASANSGAAPVAALVLRPTDSTGFLQPVLP
jgi:hypothetical protein